MTNIRRQLLPLVLAGASAFSGCTRSEHAGLPPDVRRELAAGRADLNGWLAIERAGGVPADEAVIGLGYAERLRLGMGSPFRLVESALRDPRLSDSTRHTVAWALLSRTLAGDAYEVDPVVLDRVGLGSSSHWPGIGPYHLRIIESAVTESRDPRIGELAVRLAYLLAAMEGSVPEQAPRIVARVAALIRDRELARADVSRLLRSAEAVRADPLRTIARWRSERYFAVEAPLLMPLSEAAEREALELAPRLAHSVRTLAPRLAEGPTMRWGPPDVRPSLLTPAAAARLQELADSMNMPPQAPVSIAARAYRQELVGQRWLGEGEIAQRQRLAETDSEERFVASLARLVRHSPYDVAPSLTALWAAVALRPYAQEQVWFPGFGGPTARELEERFGFAYVRFAEDVPAEWRPYFRTMLESAVRDMQRVLPALDLRGLGVRFSRTVRGEATLAMHDPRVRELVLPPGSSAGTIAHEIAHDLDWQVALRRYRVRGDYASDRASRDARDRLAIRVSQLAQDAAVDAAGTERLHAHARRPAENFARAVDWFVAASLAAQGRTNGYLSSVQDDILTGYGTVRPPDLTGRAGDALVSILDEVAPLYPETRDAFVREYGAGRTLRALDLVRRMHELELPDPEAVPVVLAGAHARVASSVLASIMAARGQNFAAVDDWICRAPGGAYDGQLEQARRRLVVESAAARARGVAIQHARLLNGEAGARWVARRFYGGPWPIQEMGEEMEQMLLDLVGEAQAVAEVPVRRQAPGFELLSTPRQCRVIALSRPASDAVHARPPDDLVQLDLVAYRQPVLQYPFGELLQIQGTPHR
jgi:hypothetical protein